MQPFPGILETLAPYSTYLWLLPAALIGCFVGWRMRYGELRNKKHEYQQIIQARDLKLRTLQSHMDTKDTEFSELQATNCRDLIMLKKQITEIDPLKISLGKTKTLLAQVNKSKIAQQREFADTLEKLNRKIKHLENNKLEDEQYHEKYSALQTKYKQMDAKRARELVELKQDIVDLRASSLSLEKDRNEHAARAARDEKDLINIKRANEGDRASFTAISRKLKEKDDRILGLEKQLIADTNAIKFELKQTETKLAANERVARELDNKKMELASVTQELAGTRQQTETLTNRIQELTENSQVELVEYDKKQARQAARLESVQSESGRQITAMRERISELHSLSTVNKNQARTIDRLEKQLQDQRKRTEQYQTLEANLVTSHADRDALGLKLKSAEDAQIETTRLLDTAQDALRQTQFENRKITGLQNQLNEKNNKLKKLQQSLIDNKNELSTTVEQTRLASDAKYQGQLTTKENKIASLQAEVERSKSVRETLASAETKLADTITKLRTTEQKLATIETSAVETVSKLDALTATKTLLESANDKIHTELTEANTSLTTLKAELKTAESARDTATAACSDSNDKLASSESRLRSAESTLDSLESKFIESEAKLNSADEELSLTVSKLSASQSALTKAQQKSASLEGSQKQAQELEDRLTGYKQTIAQLNQSVSEYKSKTETLQKTDKALADAISSTQRLGKDLKDRKAEITLLNRELAQLESTRKKLSEQDKLLTQLKQSVARYEKTSAADEQELLTLRTQTEQLAVLKKQNASSTHKVKQLTDELDHASKTMRGQSAFIETLEAADKKSQMVSQELQILRNSVEPLKTESKKLKIQLNIATQDKAMLEKQVAHLKMIEADVSEQEIELEKLREVKKQVAALEQDNRQLKITVTEAQTIQQQVESLQKSNQQLKTGVAEFETLKKKITGLEKSNQQLKADVSNTEESAKQAAALAAARGKSNQQLKESAFVALEKSTQQLKESAADAGKLKSAQTELTQTRQKIAELEGTARKLEQLQATITIKDNELVKLKRENERFKILEASVQDRQKDINRLQTEINSLSRLEQTMADKDREIKKLRPLAQHIKNRDSKIAELNAELESAQKVTLDTQGAEVDMKRLRSQVQSLTKERDLGLERVKELSESERQLVEKDKTIRQLKTAQGDVLVNSRELEALRARQQRSDLEINHKNVTIEELKKMLRDTRNQHPVAKSSAGNSASANTGIMAKGPSVVKTRTVRSATAANSTLATRTALFTAAAKKDDLKKIHGIGPVMEKMLNELGINSYAQIAGFSANDISRVTEAIETFPGRVERDDWVGGARLQHKEKYGKETS